MTNYKEILRLHQRLRVSKLKIAESLGCSRTTVIGVLSAADRVGVTWEDVKGLSDRETKRLLYPSDEREQPQFMMPDFDRIHAELRRSGVTLTLLWVEYCEECRNGNRIPYQKTQFYKYYREYAERHKATMVIHRKPGDAMEVDWAGDPAHLTDAVTGVQIKAYVFVAVLAYSKYAYAEAFLDMKEGAWIAAHNHAYRYFGGVTRILTPDNLKVGVVSNTRDETVINRAYQEMAEHYDTAVLPARVRKPRDKANAEGEVGVISTWIIAALRNCRFFTIEELNAAIRERLDEYNAKPFQKKDGSRRSLYQEETPFLRPLPNEPFEVASWKARKVQFDYHVGVGGKYYSVPYEFVGKDVEVRVTAASVEVFYAAERIASHPLLGPYDRKYSTLPGHMPERHRKAGEWNADRFRGWADKFGPNTRTVIDRFFENAKAEEQAFKTCRALLHLADKYSAARLEAACGKALSFSDRPSLRGVRAILKAGRDRRPDLEDLEPERMGPSPHGFTRGADYYGGGED
jgi:transposase